MIDKLDAKGPLSPEIDQVAQLRRVGFEQIGISPLYRAGSFIVSIAKGGRYQFYSDYPQPFGNRDLIGLRGIKVGTLSHSDTPCLTFVGIDGHQTEYAVQISTNGSGGPLRGENVPGIRDFAGRNFRQQLIETGFEPTDEATGVYRTSFRQYGNQEVDIYVLLKEDSVNRIVRSTESNRRTLAKGQELIEGFGVRLEGFTEDKRMKGLINPQEVVEPILQARNEIFEFEYDQYGDLTVKKVLRDITPEELEIVPWEIEEPSGFKIAGVNSTELIRSITSINRQSIKALERRMRPALRSGSGISMAGFLGMDESLLEVMAADNDFVLAQGLTHQDLGRMIKYVQEIHGRLGVSEFAYQGRKFRYTDTQWRGYQESPFNDGTQTGIDITVTNLGSGKSFKCSGLLGEMIERYGFYEGPGSRYRLNPQDVIEVFDFLKK